MLPSDELLFNPHKGFTSFQRFRGDKINENWSAETGWKMELIPKREDINANITGDGHPDTSLCYFRIPWNMLEKSEGQYDFSFIDFVLNEAASRGQKIIFRFFPNDNRPGALELPLWFIKKLDLPSVREIGDKRTPIHPQYFEAFGNLIKKIGRHIDGDKRLDSVDMAFISAWGENDQIDMVDEKDWKMLVEAYVTSFKKTPLVCQFNHYQSIKYANQFRPVGIRGDCLGNMSDMYCKHMRIAYPHVFCEFSELWKTAPINFESCWIVKHWQDKGWDIDYIIDQSLKWHISSFNEKSARIPAGLSDKMEDWIKKMGYRFAIRVVEYANEASPDDIVHICLSIENRGVAPIYHKYPLIIRLRRENEIYDFQTDADITAWMPGGNKWQGEFKLPPNIKCGLYSLEIGITDGDTHVLFANTSKRINGFTQICDNIKIL